MFRTFEHGGTEYTSASVLEEDICAASLDGVTSRLVAANRHDVALYLGSDASASWRITARRHRAHVLDFVSQDVEQSLGSALHQFCSNCPLPAVSLSKFTHELRAYAADGLFAFGFSDIACRSDRRGLDIDKAHVASRADDAVAVGLAWVAMAHFLDLPGPVRDSTSARHLPGESVQGGCVERGEGGGGGLKMGELKVLDPMCGVGTYLCAAAFVADCLAVPPANLHLSGCDASLQALQVLSMSHVSCMSHVSDIC